MYDGGLKRDSGKLNAVLAAILALASQFSSSHAAPAPLFQTIYDFGGTNSIPGSELSLGPNGQLFGTTYGGSYSDGTGSVYEILPQGSGQYGFTTLYRFDTAESPPNDGQYPYAGVAVSPDGTTLYGTTQGGGSGAGVLFSLDIAAAENHAKVPPSPSPVHKDDASGYFVLHTFVGGSDGGASHSDLAEFVLGALYLFGTEQTGGNNGDYGTLFAVQFIDRATPSNSIVVAFAGLTGASPQGKLVAASNPPKIRKSDLALTNVTLYGTTRLGGAVNYGTIFSVTADGNGFKSLHSFGTNGTEDGLFPESGMVLADKTLYGTTSSGGGSFGGTLFKINTDGGGFQTLMSFDGVTGSSPEGDLILDGNTIYGTTYDSGANGGGTVFSVNTNGGDFTLLHSFSSPVYDGDGHYTNADGGWPISGLLLDGNVLYGTTPFGGTNGVGTAYAISLPPAPLLTITRSGAQYAITWPSAIIGYTLQQNQTLNLQTWSDYPGTITNNGTNYAALVSPSAPALYFRLEQAN